MASRLAPALVALGIFVVALAGAFSARHSSAQDLSSDDLPPITPQHSYNGIVAGEEAYRFNDARRRFEGGRQFDLNADMYWRWSGASSWYPGVFEAWPLVPGSIWGWPAAASPPRITSTRPVAPP